jgi:hypothetical protein
MARLCLLDLPDPPTEYDVALARDREGKIWFEAVVDTERRDRERAQLLLEYAKGNSPVIVRKQAASLGISLSSSKVPDTQASARYMRAVRRRLTGALWELVDRAPAGTCHTAFTLIPTGLLVRPGDLTGIQAGPLMNRLRAQLNRAGAASANGWLIAALHCDFDPTAELFQFHYHGIAAGEMVEVIERLRGQGPYKREGR